MSLFPLKPTHAPVKAYYAALVKLHLHGHATKSRTGVAAVLTLLGLKAEA